VIKAALTVAISSPLTNRIVAGDRAGARLATVRDDRAIQSAADLP
jgi:hypothetical protein